MIRKFSVLLFSVLAFSLPFLSPAPQAVAGGAVGNGGGVAEKYVVYAYLHLDEYIDSCLDSSFCGLSVRERTLLTQIRDSLPQEYKTSEQIQFLSGKENQSFFIIDGVIREAATGDNVGDRVYFNSNQLYSTNGRPISLSMVIASLIHEFGHHHGVKDNEEGLLDLLGEKVARLYDGHTLTSQTYNFFGWITTAAFYGDSKSFLISNETNLVDKSFDLSDRIAKICSPEFNANYQVLSYKVLNFSWGRTQYVKRPYSARTPLTVTLKPACLPNATHPKSYSVDITYWLEDQLDSRLRDRLLIQRVDTKYIVGSSAYDDPTSR